MIVEAPTIRPLELKVYRWEWNPCGKMIVIKEKQGCKDELGLKLAQLSFSDNGTRKFVGIY